MFRAVLPVGCLIDLLIVRLEEKIHLKFSIKEKDGKIHMKIERFKNRICVSFLEYFRSREKGVVLKNKVLH